MDGDDCERWQNDTKMNINIFLHTYSNEKNGHVMNGLFRTGGEAVNAIDIHNITLFTPEATWSRFDNDKHSMLLFIFFFFIFIFWYRELRSENRHLNERVTKEKKKSTFGYHNIAIISSFFMHNQFGKWLKMFRIPNASTVSLMDFKLVTTIFNKMIPFFISIARLLLSYSLWSKWFVFGRITM